jgi:uncharacterized membrane protein HdeD (DUF308 family)
MERPLELVSRHWWWFALRGVAAILFGILAFSRPGTSLAALVLLFGAYAFVDGLFNVVGSFRLRHTEGRWWELLLAGLAGIAIGLVTWFYPSITALALLIVIAAWAIVVGIFEIGAAIRLRKVIRGEGWMIAAGVLSVAFGLLLMLSPGAGALAMIFWIGAFAIANGVVNIALAFRIRSFHGFDEPLPRPHAA